MKKKILSLVLTACMVLSLLPTMSLPASAGSMVRYNIGETSIGYITNQINGVKTSVSGDGWTWTYSSTANSGAGKGTLTLINAYIGGAFLPANTTIKLNGDSTIAGNDSNCGIVCNGALAIEDDADEGVGSLTAVSSASSSNMGIGIRVMNGALTITSGKVTAIGSTGSDSAASVGILAKSAEISGSADVTAIGGTAGLSSSYGVMTSGALNVSGGSLTAVGGYAGASDNDDNDGDSIGIFSDNLAVSGGTVVAQGGKSASNNSYGVCVDDGTVTLTGGLLVASSGVCGSGKTSQALDKAPTVGAQEPNTLAVLVGTYDSNLAVYGNSTTYTSNNNILTSTLDLRDKTTSTWSNSTDNSGWMWNAATSTLTLKNMIIIGTDDPGSDGSFGILGWGNISVVYEGVNVVCGGTSANGDSYGVMIEADKNGDRLALSGGGTLIALGRQAGKSSYGIQFLDPEETGSLQVTSGKLIALGGSSGTGAASDTGSCGLNVSQNLYIDSGNVTAVGGAATDSDSISCGIVGGAGVSVSSGQLVAVSGYPSGTGIISAGTLMFSGDANVVAAGDGYGAATCSVSFDDYGNPSITMTPADFQLGTDASDTVTLTATGGTGAAGKGTTTAFMKAVACDGGTCATAGSAVRFRMADAVIAVSRDGGQTYSNYSAFADGWNDAVDGDNADNDTVVKLFADWTAEHNDSHSSSFGSGVGFYDGTSGSDSDLGAVCVPAGKCIVLDLNGFTMDRNLNDPCSDYGGWVIANLGTLTIRDSGTGGTITGGYTGLNVTDDKSGGGIYNAGTLTLSGGTITENADGARGGGVYNVGTFTMTGGEISANLAATGEGGCSCGGGVYNAAGAVFTMTGGEISDNYSCDTANEDGGGVYNAGTFTVGGTAKITGNVAKAVYDYETNSASGGVTDNVYLPANKTITCSATQPLTSDASIGVTTADTPTAGASVAVTASSGSDYSSYFTSDKYGYRIQNASGDSAQVVELAYAMTGIFGAKFYQPQLWDCQRSPAFPVAGSSFRISGLKAPYDENLRKVSFAAPASDYVTFEYVRDVSDLDAATQARIVNSLKRYTGATASQITAAAVVKEVLHSGADQATETTLSSIGLVWALGDDGFLYTAMDGALKYSGGVGTYVTFAPHKSGDSIIYAPDKAEPYTNGAITDDENQLAPEDGTPTAPAAVTYQELIKVVDGSGAAVNGATVNITVNGSEYPGTTDAEGYVQFTDLPVQNIDRATVTNGDTTRYYQDVDYPEAVLTFTGGSTGTQESKVTVTVSTTGSGTVSYIGAGTVSDDREYELTSGDTAMFTIKPASGYYVSAATWGGTDISTIAKTGVYNAGAVTANTKLSVTFTAIPETSIFDIHYTTAQVFDVQRSPAFPDTGDSAIRFSWLDEPYDTNLERITLDTGEYIQFDKVSSVAAAGETDEYTESLQYWTDAQKISTAALVKENVYKLVDGVPTLQRTLGTGLIWCYNDPAKGFLFTTMDGVLGDCGGVGSYVSFNALRYGSSVTQLTDSAEPLQWENDWTAGTTSADDPQGQPENPGGDTVDDTQDVTFDFLGRVLDEAGDPVAEGTDVTLTWDGTDFPAVTDSNGRFVVSDLPYGENGDYTVTVDEHSIDGTLPDLSGTGNDETSRQQPTTSPETVFIQHDDAITAAPAYTIAVTKTGSGSVSPLGTVTVNDGGSLRVVFTASSGYSLSEVKIDGTASDEAKANGYYKFADVANDHTVAVTFTSDNGASQAEPVIVDGTEYDIGAKTTTDTTTTVTVDSDKLQKQLESASESVVVPITSKTDTTVAQLVVKDIEDMAKKGMTLSVDIGDVQYIMPATAVDTAELMKALGAADSTKVPVSITITNLEQSAVTVKNGEPMLNPVEFTVTAAYGGKTAEVERFSQYVQRVIEIPAGTDASKITTALRAEDGEHIPTYVFQKDGKWYAKINSLTNSTYTLIHNEQSFADASGKWYEKVADEMASRCVIFGRTNGSFDGGANITRAEFAATIIRALGLPESGSSGFSDVASSAWYYGAVSAASEYGIVCGYTDGSFRPNNSITCQEAMVIVARAAKVAELNGVTTADLSKFIDADTVGAWAREYVAYDVANGLIVGNLSYLRPNANFTRGEAATVVLRLLQKAGLVDVRAKA